VIDVVTPDSSARQPLRGVGIDLGLKDFATLSTGEKIEAQRIYRGAEQALALAQRANKKRRSLSWMLAGRASDINWRTRLLSMARGSRKSMRD